MAHVFCYSVHNMILQGHPRSLILAPLESAQRRMTSYWTSIVTLVISFHVSEILEFYLYAKSRFLADRKLVV